ncbi:MAG: hypothetical protein CL900_04510 [Dehalococcoidia bacterium]|nr:hypothetical protein [Dehalococcoidia bacterium]
MAGIKAIEIGNHIPPPLQISVNRYRFRRIIPENQFSYRKDVKSKNIFSDPFENKKKKETAVKWPLLPKHKVSR